MNFPIAADMEPTRQEANADSGKPCPPRRSGGGLGAVVSQLIAVALGGVTVFGVYFLFLEDWLKQRGQPVKVQEPAEPAAHHAAPQPGRIPEEERPTPPVIQESSLPASDPSITPEATTEVSPADRELAAERALGLARQMADQNPSAAAKWFRKVLAEHPETKAAKSAEDWLNQHPAKP